MNELLSDFGEMPVLPFDLPAAREFTRLRRIYRRHGAADLKIAAIALDNDATLLTRNLRDFAGITGLSSENPLS